MTKSQRQLWSRAKETEFWGLGRFKNVLCWSLAEIIEQLQDKSVYNRCWIWVLMVVGYAYWWLIKRHMLIGIVNVHLATRILRDAKLVTPTYMIDAHDSCLQLSSNYKPLNWSIHKKYSLTSADILTATTNSSLKTSLLDLCAK